MEIYSRYEALGMPLPDPETMCPGDCEGTGVVPIFLSVNLAPAKEGEARIVDEDDEVYRGLWLEAEAKSHAEDGWHFVKCPDCKGTGLKQNVS